jgi:hypothetical protein
MSATIPATFRPSPLVQLDRQLAVIEEGSKDRASPTLVSFLQALRDFINGMNRITPCSAAGTNLITLTPNDATPRLEKYIDYEFFVFTAAATSTGLVTMTVVPKNGTLATLKAFKNNGAAQATAGDIVLNSVYIAIFADHLDGGAGGFVIK